jgi:antitoxin component of RelBE/YafQ-DinJ toxin-antitoxin module
LYYSPPKSKEFERCPFKLFLYFTLRFYFIGGGHLSAPHSAALVLSSTRHSASGFLHKLHKIIYEQIFCVNARKSLDNIFTLCYIIFTFSKGGFTMGKFINLQFDEDFIALAERVLDDIGLDCQTFIKMCFKKLNKERNISFLMSASMPIIVHDISEQDTQIQPNMENEIMNYHVKKTKNEITAQMRDYIWDIFKSQYNAHQKIDCSYFSKLANAKTGITQGSAYIYFLILNNLVAGVPNTRTMKFDDLVVYLRYINEQLPKICIENSVKSLSESVPYWEKHIPGYFAQKVSKLVAQYK